MSNAGKTKMSMDAQILGALRGAGQGTVSGGELAQKLGISRAAIWARIEELRALGYDIEATPHLGYRLARAPDVLHADDLLSRLGAVEVIGRDIRVFQQTTSTSDVVEKLARDGVEEGAVVFAESQTRGRGRLGRPWVSPAGKGLWFSLLLRPDMRPQATTQLVVAAAVALTRAIRSQTSCQPEIKWPNDILVGGKKVAGILTELNAELDQVKYVILGIGIDVNLDTGDFPEEVRRSATSLKIETGESWDRAALAAAVLRELDQAYTRIKTGQFAILAEEWERQCVTLNRRVAVRSGAQVIHGRAESLDSEGALLVRTQHGRLEQVIGGDVTLEK
jgi:BirA family biotin operon repressor/biotin-[acetyl-CoA-carboxylase] ligase